MTALSSTSQYQRAPYLRRSGSCFTSCSRTYDTSTIISSDGTHSIAEKRKRSGSGAAALCGAAACVAGFVEQGP